MSSPALPLTWHFARRSGRRGAQAQLLAAAAAAVSALVLLILLAAWVGAGARADRTAWLTPAPDKNGTAVQTLDTTFAAEKSIIVVNLAQLPDRPATPVPPGLRSFPTPGQVYLSPALAGLVHTLPANQLADRFPKTAAYGTLGNDALASPDQLMAVIGRTATDPAVSAAVGKGRLDFGLIDRAVISGYAGTKAHPFTENDWAGMLLGASLLVIPVLALAAAAGRLGAARREQRLAALRLAGATPRQILTMTGIEAAAVGASGAIVGALTYALLLPALARLPYGIGTWHASDLWVGTASLLATVAGMALLTALSAVSALRQVANSPLGVAQESNPRRTGVIRLAVFLVLVIYVATTAGGGGLKPSQVGALLIMFYGAVWIIGPWVVDRLGRILGRYARRPATLLAARRLSSDPHSAWRTVSGLVLAGFVAGFFSVAQLASGGFLGIPNQVAVSLPHTEHRPAALQKAADRARALLTDAGLTAIVRTHPESDTGGDTLLLGAAGITVEAPGGSAQMDAVVTALTPLSGASRPFIDKDLVGSDEIAVSELRSVGLATLAISFLIAAASAGLAAAANVLDRRRIYARLRLTGTPLKVLNKARVRETVIPLVVLAGSVTAAGVYLATKLNQAVGSSIDSAGALQLAVCTLIGAATIFASISASRPLLRAVTDNPVQQPD